MLSKEAIRVQVNCQKGKQVEFTCSLNAKAQEKDRISLELNESTVDGCQIFSLKLISKQSVFEDNVNLALEHPFRIYLPVAEKPEKITCMYLFKDWWTRPGFADKYENIPPRTQVAYFKYPNKVVCLVPMVGNKFKSNLNGGTATELGLDMYSGVTGISEVDEPVCLLTEGKTYIEAVHRAFQYLAKEKNILTREQRLYPEMFEYLGWCSWDAMKTDVNENVVETPNSQVITLHESGTVGWASKKPAKKVTINGVDSTKDVKQNGEFYTVTIQESNQKETLILEW